MAALHVGRSLVVVLLVMGVVAAQAQPPRERIRPGQPFPEDRDQEDDAQDPGRLREGGIPRDEVAGDERGGEEGTEEGMPQLRAAPRGERVAPQWLPPDRRGWRLGVFAHNTDTGVVITRVIPGTAAQRVGLERGDRIVAVRGFQVGWVEDRLYPLGAELERQAGRRGYVTLLVQNMRNQRLLNLDVPLDRVR
jgi:hypothetical protein